MQKKQSAYFLPLIELSNNDLNYTLPCQADRIYIGREKILESLNSEESLTDYAALLELLR